MTDHPLDILVFSPHPDDAELGCGGSLILAADQGLRVAVADLSAGERSSRGTLEERGQEKQKAAELLGLRARFCLGLPDTDIGVDPAQRMPLIQIIRELRPRIVLAPYWEDRHPDHAAAGHLIRQACFLAGVSRVGSGSPYRPEWVYYYMLHQPFEPSFVVDVSTVWERRIAAVLAYRSQFLAEGAEPPTALSRPDFTRFLEARAIYFGAMIGAAYGEAFYLPGPLPSRQIPGLSDVPPPSGVLPPYRVYG